MAAGARAPPDVCASQVGFYQIDRRVDADLIDLARQPALAGSAAGRPQMLDERLSGVQLARRPERFSCSSASSGWMFMRL
jgi:hypothetical protein